MYRLLRAHTQKMQSGIQTTLVSKALQPRVHLQRHVVQLQRIHYGISGATHCTLYELELPRCHQPNCYQMQVVQSGLAAQTLHLPQGAGSPNLQQTCNTSTVSHETSVITVGH